VIVRRIVLVIIAAVSLTAFADELRFYLRSEPKTFNPIMVADESSETIRYLTGGVLIRLNRDTQKLEPELAQAWKVSRDGKTIEFTLRKGLHFSDGSLFTADDVVFTMNQLMDPALHSPTGDSFRSGKGTVLAKALAPDRVAITFPAPVAGMEALFDQIAILSSKSANKEKAVLGPYYVADYKPGSYVYLRKNPNYWKHDTAGRQLPYIDALKLEIQSNRDIETMNFLKGEIDLINTLDPDHYDSISAKSPAMVQDAGPSLDAEVIWFNQVPNAPIAPYKLEWFKSRSFRRAISTAVNRDDLCRVVYHGHARPAIGPVSPANRFWFNSHLKAVQPDTQVALRLLASDGFRLSDGKLYDRGGHQVEFSIITNAGNRARERMATMIQQDLHAIGITVNLTTLDFPSLIQRISADFNYESAMLGFVNAELDPNAQMNLWLSSGDTHQWNPNQKSPATTWESEIDRLMQQQASSLDDGARKRAFDKVQEIVADQAPMIYLVNKDVLVAISPRLRGAHPVILRPETYWNIERLSLAPGAIHGQ
jgi:peptide/nickel transport system substrate-binding protein